MKILCVADIHLRGGFESDEADALLKVVDIVQDRGVDLVLVNGDVFEAVSTPSQRLVFHTFLNQLRDLAVKTVVLRGNHDQPKDLMVFHDGDAVRVHETPERVLMPLYGGNLQILTIPHFNAGAVALKEQTLPDLGESGTGLFSQILADYFQKVRSHDGPSLVAFHGTISGAKLDNGHIPRENGIHLNATELTALGCPVVGGHYHACQEVAPGVWYSGSLTRQTYGESEGDKGVLLFEYANGAWLAPEFISLNPTPMHLIEAEWIEHDGEPCMNYLRIPSIEPEFYTNARVRLRYEVDQQLLPTVNLSDPHGLFAQAKELKIEQVVKITAAVRSEEMAQAESVEDCLKVWLDSKGYPADVSEKALSLLAELTNKKPAAEGLQPAEKGHEASQRENKEILSHAF